MVEKKWNFSESLRIDEQCDKAIMLCRSAYDETVTGNETVLAIAEALALIRVVNEARDKSHTLPPVKVKVPFVLHDLCEPMTRSLLEIGFDLALAAVVPQLKTVEFRNPGDKTGMCSWNPPDTGMPCCVDPNCKGNHS